MTAEGRPLLRIVRGDATPEEIAALTAVLAAKARPAARDGGGAPPRRSAWADRSRQLRPQTSHGPGQWRASGLPG